MSVTTLAEAKAYLRIGHASEDTLIQAMLDGAEDFVQQLYGLELELTVVSEYLNGGGVALWLRRAPVVSVTSVYDAECEETIATTAWTWRGSAQVFQVGMCPWPAGRNRYLVGYQAGFTGVQPSITTGILSLVRRAFDMRGDVASESVSGWSVVWRDMMRGDGAQMFIGYTNRPPGVG